MVQIEQETGEGFQETDFFWLVKLICLEHLEINICYSVTKLAK